MDFKKQDMKKSQQIIQSASLWWQGLLLTCPSQCLGLGRQPYFKHIKQW